MNRGEDGGLGRIRNFHEASQLIRGGLTLDPRADGSDSDVQRFELSYSKWQNTAQSSAHGVFTEDE